MAELGRLLSGLDVAADLRMEVTTAAGASTTAHVTGDGTQIRVDVARPEVLLGAVDRADVGRIADLLHAGGITAVVHGPAGPVASLGAGSASRLGRTLTGSAAVAPHLLGAARLVRDSGAGRVVVIALAVGLAVLAASRRRPA